MNPDPSRDSTACVASQLGILVVEKVRVLPSERSLVMVSGSPSLKSVYAERLSTSPLLSLSIAVGIPVISLDTEIVLAGLSGRVVINTESMPSVISWTLYGVKVSLLASSRMNVNVRLPISPPETNAYTSLFA